MPNWRHSTAIFSPYSNRAMNLSRSSMRLHSFQGIFALPQKAQLCNPCLRNEVSPFSQEGQMVHTGRAEAPRYPIGSLSRPIDGRSEDAPRKEPMFHRLPIVAAASVLALFCTVNAGSAAKLGARCDGFTGGRCGPGLWCDRDPGQCGPADRPGTCVKVRQLCFQLYRPVCGCNGNTYANDCHRIRSKVAKK